MHPFQDGYFCREFLKNLSLHCRMYTNMYQTHK
nr:MAG TPA: hypothetical protein [Caudoviricetes sp.]